MSDLQDVLVMVDDNRGSQNQVLGTLSTLSSVPNDETLYVHKASSSLIMATSRTKRRRSKIRTTGRGASVSGPARNMSESLTSATPGQPLNLHHPKG